MTRYRVRLEQKRVEATNVVVDAISHTEAEEKALRVAGDLHWTRSEVDEGSRYVVDVEFLGVKPL